MIYCQYNGLMIYNVQPAKAQTSLHLSKCRIFGNHKSWLKYLLSYHSVPIDNTFYNYMWLNDIPLFDFLFEKCFLKWMSADHQRIHKDSAAKIVTFLHQCVFKLIMCPPLFFGDILFYPVHLSVCLYVCLTVHHEMCTPCMTSRFPTILDIFF